MGMISGQRDDSHFDDVQDCDAQIQINVASPVYETLPLSNDGSQIRILKILPGDGEEQIRCKPVVKQLSGTVRYEALSYTWGGLHDKKAILVNGTSFTVTRNLECALKHLRKKTNCRDLWVDAACINQRDLQERGEQVRFMGQIYRNAEQVLIWLGPAAKGTDLAYEYIRYNLDRRKDNTSGVFHEQCCSGYGNNRMNNFKCHRCVRIQQGIVEGLKSLVQRPWWTRIWVVQEVAMAAGDPLVGCGKSWIPWSDLVKYERLGHRWPGPRERITHLHEIRLDVKKPPRLRDSMEPLPYSDDVVAADDVFHWLQRTAQFQCRDPRDKIYALLGMARNKIWRDFQPDYSISAENLLDSLVVDMITKGNSLDILTLCRFRSPGWTSHGSPSWMPSFAVKGLSYLATVRTLPRESPIRQSLDIMGSFPRAKISKSVTSLFVTDLTLNDTESGEHVRSQINTPWQLLEVSGLVLDVVGEVPVQHELLNVSMMNGAIEPLDGLGSRDRAPPPPSSLDSILRALYFWAPVWRALDPACLQIGDGIDVATSVDNLEQCVWAKAELGIREIDDTKENRELPRKEHKPALRSSKHDSTYSPE